MDNVDVDVDVEEIKKKEKPRPMTDEEELRELAKQLSPEEREALSHVESISSVKAVIKPNNVAFNGYQLPISSDAETPSVIESKTQGPVVRGRIKMDGSKNDYSFREERTEITRALGAPIIARLMAAPTGSIVNPNLDVSKKMTEMASEAIAEGNQLKKLDARMLPKLQKTAMGLNSIFSGVKPITKSEGGGPPINSMDMSIAVAAAHPQLKPNVTQVAYYRYVTTFDRYDDYQNCIHWTHEYSFRIPETWFPLSHHVYRPRHGVIERALIIPPCECTLYSWANLNDKKIVVYPPKQFTANDLRIYYDVDDIYFKGSPNGADWRIEGEDYIQRKEDTYELPGTEKTEATKSQWLRAARVPLPLGRPIAEPPDGTHPPPIRILPHTKGPAPTSAASRNIRQTTMNWKRASRANWMDDDLDTSSDSDPDEKETEQFMARQRLPPKEMVSQPTFTPTVVQLKEKEKETELAEEEDEEEYYARAYLENNPLAVARKRGRTPKRVPQRERPDCD